MFKIRFWRENLMILCLNEAKNTDLALARASRIVFGINEIQAQKGKFASKG